jgi:predicted dehydrogenase
MAGQDADSSTAPVIGLVGVGRWGRHILRDLVSLGCEVHAVARSEFSQANAREFGARSIVESVEKLPRLDAAVAAPIVTRHAAVIERLAAHTTGPIFSEKPLTADVEEAERLARALPDRLFVMDKWRYHAGILELARLAGSGTLGEVRGIASRRVSTRNPHPDVNTLWTHAPHDFTIALEVLGEIPPLQSAVGEVVAGELRGATAIFGAATWMTIEVSDNAPDHRRETRVIGSEAAVILDGGWAEHVTVRRFDGAPDERIETPGELPLLAELRAFVEHVGGGPAPKSSAAEGLLVVRRVQELIDIAGGGLQ